MHICVGANIFYGKLNKKTSIVKCPLATSYVYDIIPYTYNSHFDSLYFLSLVMVKAI